MFLVFASNSGTQPEVSGVLGSYGVSSLGKQDRKAMFYSAFRVCVFACVHVQTQAHTHKNDVRVSTHIHLFNSPIIVCFEGPHVLRIVKLSWRNSRSNSGVYV